MSERLTRTPSGSGMIHPWSQDTAARVAPAARPTMLHPAPYNSGHDIQSFHNVGKKHMPPPPHHEHVSRRKTSDAGQQQQPPAAAAANDSKTGGKRRYSGQLDGTGVAAALITPHTSAAASRSNSHVGSRRPSLAGSTSSAPLVSGIAPAGGGSTTGPLRPASASGGATPRGTTPRARTPSVLPAGTSRGSSRGGTTPRVAYEWTGNHGNIIAFDPHHVEFQSVKRGYKRMVSAPSAVHDIDPRLTTKRRVPSPHDPKLLPSWRADAAPRDVHSNPMLGKRCGVYVDPNMPKLEDVAKKRPLLRKNAPEGHVKHHDIFGGPTKPWGDIHRGRRAPSTTDALLAQHANAVATPKPAGAGGAAHNGVTPRQALAARVDRTVIPLQGGPSKTEGLLPATNSRSLANTHGCASPAGGLSGRRHFGRVAEAPLDPCAQREGKRMFRPEVQQ